MAYRAFLDPNKPCFLKELYLHFKTDLHNDRTLFEGDIDTGIRSKGLRMLLSSHFRFPHISSLNPIKKQKSALMV